jgi:Na+/melibiose symporter-like transporter
MAAQSGSSFSFADFSVRVILSVALVFLTYNPTRFSYVSWLLDYAEGDLPLVVLAGIALLICFVIYIRATLRSIGLFGMALAAAFTAALIWVLVDFGIVDVEGGNALQWIVLATIAFILGIGLSWSHVRRLLSGQADVDDVDE